MPLDHLLAALEREATAQAEALLAAARAEVATIAGDSAAELARRRREALAVREAELRGAAELAFGAARRAGRARVLEARQRLIERVLGAAQAMFPAALASPAYASVLPQHLAEALGAIGDGAAVIRCPTVLGPAVRAAVAGRVGVTVAEDAAAPPGVTVATADGAIEVDNTLGGRLERLRLRVAIEVVGQLAEAP